MTCKECSAPFVKRGGTMTTLLGCQSPEGHDHDSNCMSRVYECANGHHQVISLRRSCPACDWVGRETCFCHSDPKVTAWPAGDVTYDCDLL